MKIIYSNSIKDSDKYSKTLVWRYSNLYPEFSTEQLRDPIIKVVNNISGPIGRMESYEEVLSQIGILKSFIKQNYQGDDIQRASSNGLILSYSKGDEKLLRKLMKDKFPEENKDRYLQFVSDMSKNAIREISQATENAIPHSTKINYQRSLTPYVENINMAPDRAGSTFIDRLEKKNKLPRKKRAFADIIRTHNNEEDTNLSSKNELIDFEDKSIETDRFDKRRAMKNSNVILVNRNTSKNSIG